MSSWISQLEAEPMHLVNGRLMLVKGCNRSYPILESNRRVFPSRLHLVHLPKLPVGTKVLGTTGSLNRLPPRRGRQRAGNQRVGGVPAGEEIELPIANLGRTQVHNPTERMSLCYLNMVRRKLSKNANLDQESNHDLHIEQPEKSGAVHWFQMIEWIFIY